MAVKKRPESAKATLGRQRAQTKRGAPGKRFIGETAGQSAAARRAELERVARMAEADAAARRLERIRRTPIARVVLELVENTARLAATLAWAPFRLGMAFWRPREA